MPSWAVGSKRNLRFSPLSPLRLAADPISRAPLRSGPVGRPAPRLAARLRVRDAGRTFTHLTPGGGSMSIRAHNARHIDMPAHVMCDPIRWGPWAWRFVYVSEKFRQER